MWYPRSPEVRDKVASPLATAPASPTGAAGGHGISAVDRDRLVIVIDGAVASNRRYESVARVRPHASVTAMPTTQITRVEMTYPAPTATKDLEPGPLTVDVWICPDRQSALALFGCRRGGTTVLGATPEDRKQRILAPGVHDAEPLIPQDRNPPRESASWIFPRTIISVVLPKGHGDMPSDRLAFLRGHLIVEASTVEYTRSKQHQKWLAFNLRDCVPDVLAAMRELDSGLVLLAGPGQASPKS